MLTEMKQATRGCLRQPSLKALHLAGLLKVARRLAARRNNTLVLMLHRVIPDDALSYCRSPRGMVLRESGFRSLLAYLREHTDLIAPVELSLNSHHSGRPRVLITFDDGWADNYDVALPLLEEHGVRACFFAVTGYIGHKEPFWPERLLGLVRALQSQGRPDLLNEFVASLNNGGDRFAPKCGPLQEERLLNWIKQFEPSRIYAAIHAIQDFLGPCAQACMPDPSERLMTWDQLRALAHAGHMVASHTSTHALLTRVPSSLAAAELTHSATDLAAALKPAQAETGWIAYPNGDVNEAIQKQAYRYGYRFGFTTRPGIWRNCGESLSIPRVNIWDGCLMSPDGVFDESRLEYSLFWRPMFGDR